MVKIAEGTNKTPEVPKAVEENKLSGKTIMKESNDADTNQTINLINACTELVLALCSINPLKTKKVV